MITEMRKMELGSLRGPGYSRTAPELIKDAFFDGYQAALEDEEYKRLGSTGNHTPKSSFKYSTTAYVCCDVKRQDQVS